MTKAGKQIIEGLEEAVEFAKGKKTGAVLHTIHVPEKINSHSYWSIGKLALKIHNLPCMRMRTEFTVDVDQV